MVPIGTLGDTASSSSSPPPPRLFFCVPKMPRRRFTKEAKVRARTLIDEGHSAEYVASQVGVTKKCIYELKRK